MHRVLFFFLFLTFAASADPAGLWWVAHGTGEPLQIRLYPDGSAWSDYSANNPGTWRQEGPKVICLWADDWKEVFVPDEYGWKKFGYEPGVGLDQPPSNQSRAYLVSPRPNGWFGWAP